MAMAKIIPTENRLSWLADNQLGGEDEQPDGEQHDDGSTVGPRGVRAVPWDGRISRVALQVASPMASARVDVPPAARAGRR